MINTPAARAVGGAFWGMLIGLIFLMPLAGRAHHARRYSGGLVSTIMGKTPFRGTQFGTRPGNEKPLPKRNRGRLHVTIRALTYIKQSQVDKR
jgi:hypothetical protein